MVDYVEQCRAKIVELAAEQDDKYMEKLKNRVYGYLISQYYDG